MGEEAEENGDNEAEDLALIRHTVPEQAIAEVVLNDPNELLLLEEARLRLLEDGQDQLKTDYLRPYHVVADLLVTLWLFLPFNGQLDNAAEDKNGILKSCLSFFRHGKVGRSSVMSTVEGRAFNHVLFLALSRAHGVLSLRTDKLGRVATYDAPTVLARGETHLVLYGNGGYLVLRLLQSCIDL